MLVFLIRCDSVLEICTSKLVIGCLRDGLEHDHGFLHGQIIESIIKEET